MIPISVNSNLGAVQLGAQRAQNYVDNFNSGLRNAGKEFGDSVIKGRFLVGEWANKFGEQNKKDFKELDDKFKALGINSPEDIDLQEALNKSYNNYLPNSVDLQDLEDGEEGNIITTTTDYNRQRQIADLNRRYNQAANLDNLSADNADNSTLNDVNVNLDSAPSQSHKLDLNSPEFEYERIPPKISQDDIDRYRKLKNKVDNFKEYDLPHRAAETAGLNMGYPAASVMDMNELKRLQEMEKYRMERENNLVDKLDHNERNLLNIAQGQNVSAENALSAVQSMAQLQKLQPEEVAQRYLNQDQIQQFEKDIAKIGNDQMKTAARNAMNGLSSGNNIFQNLRTLATYSMMANMNISDPNQLRTPEMNVKVNQAIMNSVNLPQVQQEASQLFSREQNQAWMKARNIPQNQQQEQTQNVYITGFDRQ